MENDHLFSTFKPKYEEVKTCYWCGKTAFYRWRKVGACEGHKDRLNQERKLVMAHYAAKGSIRQANLDTWDKHTRRHQQAAKTSKFGG